MQANALDEAEGYRKREHAVVVPGTKRHINSQNWLSYKEVSTQPAPSDALCSVCIGDRSMKLQAHVATMDAPDALDEGSTLPSSTAATPKLHASLIDYALSSTSGGKRKSQEALLSLLIYINCVS